MLSFFKRRTSEQPRQAADSDEAAHPRLHEPALTGRVYVIGDVHGCAKKLAALEQAIKVDCGFDYDNATLVYVGDVVDRGPDSATVLDRLSFPTRAGPRRITLFGNHEQMMLKFLKDPSGKSSWLDFGGAETLSSYGIHADPQRGWNLPARSWRYTLDANIPAAHTEFLSTLPCCAQFGRYFISHSGIDVKKPLADQTLRDLLWSRPIEAPPLDQVTIIHGHTVVPEVAITDTTINVDTGAYATGKLSAVCLAPDSPPRVLQA